MHAFLLLAILLTPEQPVAPQFGPSPEYAFNWTLATNGENYLLGWSAQYRTHFVAIDDRGVPRRDAQIASAYADVDSVALGHDYVLLQQSENATELLTIDSDTLAVKERCDTRFKGKSGVLATDGESLLYANATGFAQRVGLDAAPIDFAHGNTGALGAAGAQRAYLLVWLDNGRLVRSVIDNGVASAPATLVTIDPVQLAFGRRSVASNGSDFLVAWRSLTAVNVAHVTRDGAIAGEPVTIGTFDYTGSPQLSWNGREYVVVLETRAYATPPESEIVAIHLDSHGTPVGATQTLATGTPLHYNAVVASSPHGTFAAWGEFAACFQAGHGGIVGRTVEPLGELAMLTRGESALETPAAAATASSTLVAWIDRGSLRKVRAMLTGPRGGVIEIPTTSYAQDSPAIGSNGSSFLLVFAETASGDCATSLSAVAIDGEGHAGPVWKLADDAQPRTRMAIAWNGSEYAVVWERGSVAELLGIRVAADGHPLDREPSALTLPYPNPIYTNYGTDFPSIVWTGSEYLATWTFIRSSYIPLYPDPPPILELHARRFDRNLAVIGAENTIANPAYGSTTAWNGSEGLVLWQSRGTVRASRIAADGSVKSTSDLFSGLQYMPPSLSLVWSGSDWIATFGRHLLRIDADGTLRSDDDLGATVSASAVAGSTVIYQRDDVPVTRVYVRTFAPQRRRAAM